MPLTQPVIEGFHRAYRRAGEFGLEVQQHVIEPVNVSGQAVNPISARTIEEMYDQLRFYESGIAPPPLDDAHLQPWIDYIADHDPHGGTKEYKGEGVKCRCRSTCTRRNRKKRIYFYR
jgi:hypothetical protein